MAKRTSRDPGRERLLREAIYAHVARLVPARCTLVGKRLSLYQQHRGARYDPPSCYRADLFVVWSTPRSKREVGHSVSARGIHATRVAALEALLAELDKHA